MNAGQLQEIFREIAKDLGTSIAGHILAFDVDTQLAQVQIGVGSLDRKGNTITPDPIIECPVEFSGGGGWSFEHKMVAGDEGLIIFSQRCLDGWIQTGGVANNPIARFHDKQDACFIPGVRSKPNAIKGFQNNGIRLRNADASVYHWLKDDGTIESKNLTSLNTQLPDGTITLSNAAGASITMQSSGTVLITSASGLVIASPLTTTSATPAGDMSETNGAATISKSPDGTITLTNTAGAEVGIKADGSTEMKDNQGAIVRCQSGVVDLIGPNGVRANGRRL